MTLTEPRNNREQSRLGDGLYTITDISRILKIPRNKISYIFRYYMKGKFEVDLDYTFSVSDELNVVNFKSLIEIKVFSLWKDTGVPVKNIVNAHHALSKKYDTKYPLALENLAVAGQDVIDIVHENFYVKADGSEQPYFVDLIHPFLKKVEYGSDKMASKLYPLGKKGAIVIDPNIQFGQPVYKGTRITIENLVAQNKAGDGVDFLSKLYNLQPNRLRKCLEYYNKAA